MSLALWPTAEAAQKAAVTGLTFKENCGDLRNSKVIDIIHGLQSYAVEVFVTALQAPADEAVHEHGVKLTPFENLPRADAVVAAVAHRVHAALWMDDFATEMFQGGAFIDVKAAYDETAIRGAGYRLQRF